MTTDEKLKVESIGAEMQAVIERLRAQIAAEVILSDSMRREIERLRGIVEFSEAASRQQREGFQAEIARLRAGLVHNSEWRDENIRVWAEVERLKAALREIVDVGSATSVQIAIAALERK